MRLEEAIKEDLAELELELDISSVEVEEFMIHAKEEMVEYGEVEVEEDQEDVMILTILEVVMEVNMVAEAVVVDSKMDLLLEVEVNMVEAEAEEEYIIIEIKLQLLEELVVLMEEMVVVEDMNNEYLQQWQENLEPIHQLGQMLLV